MVNRFLEENYQLPGDVYEPEEQKKTPEQTVAETLAEIQFQESNTQLPGDVGPSPSAPPPQDFGPELPNQQPSYIPQEQPAAPAPDPMDALNALLSQNMLDQNILPDTPTIGGGMNPILDTLVNSSGTTIRRVGADEAYFDASYGKFNETFELQIKPLEDEVLRLGRIIEQVNQTGVLPAEFSSFEDLQQKYDAAFSSFDTKAKSYGQEKVDEIDRLTGLLEDDLLLGPAGEGLEYTSFDGGSTGLVTSSGYQYQVSPGVSLAELSYTNQRIQENLMDRDMREQRRLFDAGQLGLDPLSGQSMDSMLRQPENLTANYFEYQDQREANMQALFDRMDAARNESIHNERVEHDINVWLREIGGQPRNRYEMDKLRQMEGEFIVNGTRSANLENSHLTEFVDRNGVYRVSAAASATGYRTTERRGGEGRQSTQEQVAANEYTSLGGLPGMSYPKKIVTGMQWVWGKFPEPVQDVATTLIDLPQDIVASVYTYGSEMVGAAYRLDPRRAVDATINLNRDLIPVLDIGMVALEEYRSPEGLQWSDLQLEEQLFNRPQTERMSEQVQAYQEEVPIWVRLPAEVAVGIWADPLNLITPMVWLRQGKNGLYVRENRKTLGLLLADASSVRTEADTAFMDGVSVALNRRASSIDVSKQQLVQDKILGMSGVKIEGDKGLMDEFTQRVSYRTLNEPDDAFSTIIDEEWGRIVQRADDEGVDVAVRAGTKEEILALNSELTDIWRQDHASFWNTPGYRDQIVDDFNLSTDRAWREQQAQRVDLLNVRAPYIDGNETIFDIAAWNMGPNEVMNGQWYQNMIARQAETVNPIAVPLRLADEAVGDPAKVFLDTQHELLARTSPGYEVPKAPRNHKETMDQVRNLNARSNAFPAGRTDAHVLQDADFQRMYHDNPAETVTIRQLQLLEAKSKSSGVNLFDQLANPSERFDAWTKDRMNELLQHLPATEAQKAALYDIAGITGDAGRVENIGFANVFENVKGKKLVGPTRNTKEGRELLKQHIDRMSFDEAYETLGRHWGTIADDPFDYNFSVGSWLDDPVQFAHVPQDIQIKRQMSMFFDDLLIRSGKAERGFTAWHTQRMTPEMIARAAKDAVDPIKSGVYGAALANDPYYGGILKQIAETADKNWNGSVKEIEELLEFFVQIPRISPMSSDSTALKWLIDVTETSQIRRAKTSSYRFRGAGGRQISDATDARNVARDLSSTRAIFAAQKSRFDRYEGFLSTFLTPKKMRELRDVTNSPDMEDIIRRGIGNAAKRLGTTEKDFEQRAIEFLGERTFSRDKFFRDYKTLRDDVKRGENSVKDLERLLDTASDTVPEAKTWGVAMGTYNPADDVAAFAKQFQGQMPYVGPTVSFQQYFARQTPNLNAFMTGRQLQSHVDQAMKVLRDDSTAEMTFAKTVQNSKSGITTRNTEIKTLATSADNIMGDSPVGVQFRSISTRTEGHARKTLDGAGISVDRVRNVAERARSGIARSVRIGDGSVNFGSAMDEVVWRARLAPAEERLSKEQLAYLTDPESRSGITHQLLTDYANKMDESIKAFRAEKGILGDTPMYIVDGKATVDSAGSLKLLRGVKTAAPRAAKSIVNNVRNIEFSLTSGSSQLSEWAKVEGFDWHRRVTPRFSRPEVDVYSPYMSAVGEVDWLRNGEMIDRVIESGYARDPIWNPPRQTAPEAVDKLNKMSKTVRMGDDMHLFFGAFMEMADGQGYGANIPVYDRIRWIGDRLAAGDPDTLKFYGEILDNTSEGRRVLDWMQLKDKDGITNWERVKASWHTLTPHFSASRMPEAVFSQVGETQNGRRIFTDLERLDKIITKGPSYLNMDNLTDLEKDEIATWVHGMQAIWGRVDENGVPLIDTLRKNGKWSDIVHPDDIDAAILPEHAGEPVDKAGFLNNLANRVSEVEAQRLGLDYNDIPAMMKLMYAVKGNLGYFWLGIPPRYLINNVFGNIMGQILYAARTSARGGFGLVPDEVSAYWREGGYIPRWLDAGMTPQSQFSEAVAQRGINRTNTRLSRGAELRGNRVVSPDVARRTDRDAFLQNARQVRRDDKLIGGDTPFIPKLIDKSVIGRPVTFWADNMAWMNESLELFSRRNIYGQEMWASFTDDFGKRLDNVPLDPVIRQQIEKELDSAKVINILSDASVDPRVAGHIQQQHAMAKSYADLRAYDQGRKAMRDYRMRNTWDSALDRFFPYQFWTQKNLLFTASSIAERPAILAHAYRALDLVYEGAEGMPDSYKERLKTFTIPKQVPGIGGSTVWLKLNNLANPAIIAAAMTVRQFRDDQQNMSENTTVMNRIFQQAFTGGKMFYENLGMQAGPQFTTPLAAFTPQRVDKWVDNDFLVNDLYESFYGPTTRIANPNDYRPDLLPLGGLEDVAFGLTDLGLSQVTDDKTIRARRLYEYMNQKAYGSAFSNFELMMAGYVITDMAAEGYFGEIELNEDAPPDQRIQSMSGEAFANMVNTMIALAEGDLDNPMVRDVLDRNYKNQSWHGGLSILGLNSSLVSEDLQRSFDINAEYNRIRDEQGWQAANRFLIGSKKADGSYVGGQGLTKILDRFVWDGPDELRNILLQFNVGEPFVRGEGVTREGEEYTYSISGLNALGPIQSDNYLESVNQRSEQTKFYSARQPYWDDIGEVSERYDSKIRKELAKDKPNMVLVDLYDKESRRAVSAIYDRAEKDGLPLSISDKQFPRGSSKWWDAQADDISFLEINDVQLVDGRTYEPVSRDRQADITERQTWYIMDLVTTQLGIEKYNQDGSIKSEWLDADGRFDQEEYDAAIDAAVKLAPQMYHDLALTFSNNTYGSTLMYAQMQIRPDEYKEYLTKNTIPELEQWRTDRDASFKNLATLSGDEYTAAELEHERKYGEIIRKPTDRPLIRNMAVDIAEMFQNFESSQRQKDFMGEYSHLFNEDGIFQIEKVTIDDIFTIGQDFNLEFPETEMELGEASQGAYMISYYWYNVLQPNKKNEWLERYGDPDHEDYIPGFITEEVKTDPETNENYTVYKLDNTVLRPADVAKIIEEQEFPEFGVEDQEITPDSVRAASETRLGRDTLYERDMRFQRGQFYSGEAYLDDDELDNKRLWQTFKDDNTEMYQAATDRYGELKAANPDRFITWEYVAANAGDPELSRFITNEYLPLYEELGMSDINRKGREWLDHTPEGQDIKNFFPDDNFLENISDLSKDSPTVREAKEAFNAGEGWISNPDEQERWQTWNAYLDSNDDLENRAMELKIASNLSWKELGEIDDMDPALLEYIRTRAELYKDLEVFDLETKAAIYLTSEEGQAVYWMDTEYFDGKLWPLEYADDLSSPSGSGGSDGSKGGYASTSSRSKSSGFNYSSDRPVGYQRKTIEGYSGSARDIFLIDKEMVGGQVADSEQRMTIAMQVADLVQSKIDVYNQLGLGTEWIQTLSGLWVTMAKQVLGENPTLEDWMRLLQMLDKTEPGMPIVNASPTINNPMYQDQAYPEETPQSSPLDSLLMDSGNYYPEPEDSPAGQVAY